VFERLPVFTNRNTLPLHRPSSIAEAKPWSTEQEKALTEGLEDHAGTVVQDRTSYTVSNRSKGPRVFHEIFRAYCRPGGPLRDFNVVDIVTQAGFLRSSLLKLCQEKSWPIPAWVKQIPVFP
jgi:hypothetical protein